MALGESTARYRPSTTRPSRDAQIAPEFTAIALPGARVAHSDNGYDLAELVIEVCTVEDLGSLMTRDVLQSLGMQGARFD